MKDSADSKIKKVNKKHLTGHRTVQEGKRKCRII